MSDNRTRALRRFNRARVIRNRSNSRHYKGCTPVKVVKGKLSRNHYIPEYGNWRKCEKNWKLLWRRAQKNHRARKLGFDYPDRNLRDYEFLQSWE